MKFFILFVLPFLVLEEQNDHKYKDCYHQAHNALHRPRVLLCPFRPFQLLDSRLGALHDRLHIVIDPIQNGPLVDDQNRKLFEDCPEFLDSIDACRSSSTWTCWVVKKLPPSEERSPTP